MLFLNPWLLAGLVGVSIPIIIHLVRQRAAKPIDWGAMRFLFDTLALRRRRMQWEDLLLMATRCLLLGLLALALARPFVAPDSSVPWSFVLPAAFIGIALLGSSFVLSGKPRWITRGLALVLLLSTTGLMIAEKIFNLKRFAASGSRDVALIIDGSSSMELTHGSKSVFRQAIEEAKEVVKAAPRGTAFTVILGGPTPEVKTSTPLTHRADVLGVLDSLQPVGGTFHAHDALGMATLGLSESHHFSKEILVFTDDQRAGWRLDHPAAWQSLDNAWAGMTAKPKLMVRNFGQPTHFHNLAITSIEPSRQVVGTDRELVLRVTIENTGTEAITVGPVMLESNGEIIGAQATGLLIVGQKETVEFRHRFTKPGPQIIKARIESKDDLASDNHCERVIQVRSTLPILLVDGNPAGSFFERAAGYSALALAPSTSLINGQSAGENFLMDPRVIAAPSLRAEDLEDAAVIVLADVSRLPAKIAAKLASKVSAGAGLLVIAGPRAEATFYNAWNGVDGKLLPMMLGEEVTDIDGISLATSTFTHEALALLNKCGDLQNCQVKRWRKTGETINGGIQAAAFSNGDPFLASQNYGNGRTWLATCAFDARSGNLPARSSFVPLLHQLVTWAAGSGLNLNIEASWSPSIALQGLGNGLTAQYFQTKDQNTKPEIIRIDPAINFNWENNRPDRQIPEDGFSVHWRGSLVAPVSGDYLFDAEVDDQLELRIGDHDLGKALPWAKELGHVTLKAGEPVLIEMNYEEEDESAYLRLFWTPPNGTRELVPSSAFLPLVGGANSAMTVVDPLGLPRLATIRSSRHGQELVINGSAIPGVYQVATGQSLNQVMPGLNGGQLPIAVKREPAESRFEPMTNDDLTLIRKHADLRLPRSVTDILSVLQGKGFGREIWKLLASAALILFLLESVLARWVSRSRCSADDVRVAFGEDVGSRAVH